jgi:hypothetical protein
LTILQRLAEDLKDVASIENQPKLEGRNMFMLIAPLKKHDEKSGRKSSHAHTSSATDIAAATDAAEPKDAEGAVAAT